MDVIGVPLEVTFPLRSNVLGWTPPRVRIDDDNASHLALVDEDAVIAVVSHVAWPCPDHKGVPARYFWAMAVAATHQRRGYGRRMLGAVADHAGANQEKLLWADARESAVDFYIACGADVSAQSSIDEVTGLVDRRVLFKL